MQLLHTAEKWPRFTSSSTQCHAAVVGCTLHVNREHSHAPGVDADLLGFAYHYDGGVDLLDQALTFPYRQFCRNSNQALEHIEQEMQHHSFLYQALR